MTGTIVGLAAATRTGTIRSQDGCQLVFSAVAVLGDFETLAVGHRVSFELDRARPHHAAVGVFREPVCASGSRKDAAAPPDLRYTGFKQTANMRTYLFQAVSLGHPVQQFVVTVDLALMAKHHVGVQEAPPLCLHKLAEDLRHPHESGRHELADDDLLAFASSRAAALERRKPRHSFVRRPGTPPPGRSQDWPAS
jgi:hypothetical protein